MKKLLTALLLLVILPNLAWAKTYDLEVKKQNVFITGKAVEALTINDQIPAPTLRFKEGEDVEIRVKNSTDETTSLHWHGILLDGKMDGVPGLNGFHGIAPGETFTYKFKLRQAGTYWYHSHSNFQEQRGMYGAIVVEPKNSDKNITRDYVIVLSDFTEENPQTILNNLKIDSGYYNYAKRTVFTFFSDVKKDGFWNAAKSYAAWGEMKMDPTDLADVTKYHFLINGKTNDQFWQGIFKAGQRVRLRFINAAAMTIFDVSIPGLKLQVVEADGQLIKPVEVDEFRIGVAETYDVIVDPQESRAYAIFAESLDRTGYALGALVNAPPSRATASLRAATRDLPLNRGNASQICNDNVCVKIPKMRPRAVLTMSDMGMDHDMENMNHDEMAEMKSGWDERGTPQGNKALSYSDLASLHPQKDLRQPTREIEFRFGGNMNRYIWTINGEKFPQPLHVKFGERVRLKFINDTMMAHPVHLHGMFMQLENDLSTRSATKNSRMSHLPNKHTVILPPGQTVTTLLTADEAGEWAFHCHLLFHMASGMMTSLTVEKNRGEVR